MSTNLSSVPKLQFFDANGNPLAGGKLYTYAAGTTTPLATYTDSTGLTPNTNPIILDSRGEANVWLDATQYKFELTTAADALIWTVDNISNALNLSQLLASSGSAAAPPYTFAADPTTGMYLQAVGQIGLSANGKPVLRSTDVTMVIGQIGGADDVDVTLYGDLALAGDITITGTGRRITGDFSNATVANRLMFQTSTVDGVTQVAAIPNGTTTIANFAAYGTSSPVNDSKIQMTMFGGSDARFESGIVGTGTYLPLTIYTGGSERVRVDTSGNVGIGTASPSSTLHVYKATSVSSIVSTASHTFTMSVLDNGTGFPPIPSETTLTSDTDRFIIDTTVLTTTATTVNAIGVYNSDISSGFGQRDVFVAPISGQLGYVSSLRNRKTDIQPISNISWIYGLNPVTFFYKKKVDGVVIDEPEGSRQIGLIAEEVEQVNPSMCFYDNVPGQGLQLRGVSYSSLIIPLLKAIQEQQAVIEQLTQRIAALEQA